MRSVIAVIALAVALAACHHGVKSSCPQPREFASAQDDPPLKIPAGLDKPDTHAAMHIPNLAEPERQRAANEPCLDRPPKYSTTARPAPPAPPAPAPAPRAVPNN